ncbi:MAG: hypothetical protein U9N58_02245 [Thermodesulfobacteriota bacterium]|nr:hypothetical protein [Thermodesulfobacteriota bacterium]
MKVEYSDLLKQETCDEALVLSDRVVIMSARPGEEVVSVLGIRKG